AGRAWRRPPRGWIRSSLSLSRASGPRARLIDTCMASRPARRHREAMRAAIRMSHLRACSYAGVPQGAAAPVRSAAHLCAAAVHDRCFNRLAPMGTSRGDWIPPERFDEYRLLEMLGRGSMGQVWLAHDAVLDRQVAVKFLSELPTDDPVRLRFLTEARAAARVQHP